MLKQFSGSAIRRPVLAIVGTLAIVSCIAACGVKGPLVPAPKEEANAEAPAAPATPPPLIKDPAQPERRP